METTRRSRTKSTPQVGRGRFSLVAALLGVATVGGVYADGWAHINIGGLETFFTPWHAVLYTAFTLLAVWILRAVFQRRHGGDGWSDAIPEGYGLGLVGIGVFALGGLLDMIWHLAFGVEVGIDALVSPTHLLLLVGGTLLLWSPARAAYARDESPMTWSAVLSGATVAALAGFFLSYVSVFANPQSTHPLTQIPEGAPGHQAAELPSVAGMGGYLIITVLLVVAMLSLRRLGRPPAGASIVVVAVIALPAAALSEFHFGAAALGAVLGSVVAEVLAWGIPSRVTSRIHLILLPGFVWAGQLGGLAVAGQLQWPVEMWAGVIVLSMLIAGTLGQLVAASAPPSTGSGAVAAALP